MWISNTSIRQPVFTTMVISALVVFGLVSYRSLGIDLFPKVDFPIVTITAVLPGADPETVETDVTEHIEEAVNTISGVKTLRSTSSEGVSIVVIEFELERDVDQAAQDVRDKVSSIRRILPDDLEEPVIEKLDPDASPILALALAGNKPVKEITTFAKDVVKDRLERVNGVGSIEIVGGREREVRVWLSADRLAAYGLAVDDVTRALQVENMEIPGGRIELPDTELVVRTRGRIRTPADFGDIVVAQRRLRPDLRARPRLGGGRGRGRAQPVAAERRARGVAARPPAVGHQRRGGGRGAQGRHRRGAGGPAARLHDDHRERQLGVHRAVGGGGAVPPDGGRSLRGAGHLLLPAERDQHGHLGHRDPHVDHRHVHAHRRCSASR